MRVYITFLEHLLQYVAHRKYPPFGAQNEIKMPHLYFYPKFNKYTDLVASKHSLDFYYR